MKAPETVVGDEYFVLRRFTKLYRRLSDAKKASALAQADDWWRDILRVRRVATKSEDCIECEKGDTRMFFEVLEEIPAQPGRSRPSP